MPRIIARRIVLSLAPLCAVLLASPATAQRDRAGFSETLKSWDKNGDGRLTEDEAPERAWSFIKRRAESRGAMDGDAVRIKKLIESRDDDDDDDRRRRHRDDDRDRDRRDDDRRRSSDDGPPRAAGFDTKDKPETTRSFDRGRDRGSDRRDDDRENSEQRDRAQRYARGLMDRYDRNKDRILQRDEWRRISGSPEKADKNGDGLITYDELAARLEYNYTKRDKEEREGPRREERREPPKRDEGDEKRSYRFTPPAERLPEGLPGWFRDRDRDGDGQVAMHEYASSWSDRRAEEFARYDGDGDGFVSPSEALKR